MPADRYVHSPDNGILHVRNLTKRFGRFTAVDGIDFSIKKGEILGFLGPNGAGKTTTIKMMMGLLRITEGDVLIKNLSVRTDLAKIKRFTGYMSQKFSLYPLLNSYENIEFFGGISGLSRSRIRECRSEIEDKISLGILEQKISDIPPGIRQKVALFTCLMTDPEIIFLDEPTSGVDPESRRAFWIKIYELKKMGKTLLVTTHNLDEAEYADRILILHQGRIVCEGDLDSLFSQSQVSSVEALFEKKVMSHEAD
jgi:ABC-2 type transport system ATP-binding protein